MPAGWEIFTAIATLCQVPVGGTPSNAQWAQIVEYQRECQAELMKCAYDGSFNQKTLAECVIKRGKK